MYSMKARFMRSWAARTEEGHYQTVWRRSTAVNEFGMALFVPKPEPSSAHGGSGRHTIKIDHDPPSPVAVRFEPEK